MSVALNQIQKIIPIVTTCKSCALYRTTGDALLGVVHQNIFWNKVQKYFVRSVWVGKPLAGQSTDP